ncbi:hypothetical protein J4E82_011367 [Alternaria postmessia]|uniref:uncharacterized protein n=1 Tax=Alternaria postmessia TaxID=1187938 RepID=UPI0022245123|nr:uncharacterized protein J4E82_011367 [Alternaria postmessia]KAI5365591.1 hypothetical protein J4E82_011367 [Alternaria postmessia]
MPSHSPLQEYFLGPTSDWPMAPAIGTSVESDEAIHGPTLRNSGFYVLYSELWSTVTTRIDQHLKSKQCHRPRLGIVVSLRTSTPCVHAPSSFTDGARLLLASTRDTPQFCLADTQRAGLSTMDSKHCWPVTLSPQAAEMRLSYCIRSSSIATGMER